MDTAEFLSAIKACVPTAPKPSEHLKNARLAIMDMGMRDPVIRLSFANDESVTLFVQDGVAYCMFKVMSGPYHADVYSDPVGQAHQDAAKALYQKAANHLLTLL